MKSKSIIILTLALLLLIALCSFVVIISNGIKNKNTKLSHQLDVSKGRFEIINGIIAARPHSDEILVWKSNGSADANLKSQCNLTELQIKAIMEITKPLSQISNESLITERNRLQEEIKLIELKIAN